MTAGDWYALVLIVALVIVFVAGPVEAEPAGFSASERAAKLRAEATALQAEADRYDRSAAGERRTGRILERLPGTWTVLHDLSIPGSRANVDMSPSHREGSWSSTRNNGPAVPYASEAGRCGAADSQAGENWRRSAGRPSKC